MKLKIGFSPCPNDTFIFDALVNNKINTGGIEFEPLLEDVQTLNQWALKGTLSISKVSYGVLPFLLQHYSVLNAGSALGYGVGPLFIRHPELDVSEDTAVAIPGENTTAHLLFSLAYPHMKNKVFVRYDEVEDFVKSKNGAGVIIHENRFTYEQRGLQKIRDLGEYWETATGSAIPLGGIVISKALDPVLAGKVDRLIRKSLEYSYDKYPVLSEFVKCHAQEMEEEVMRKHIDLYVNQHSLDLGAKGRAAINSLLDVYEGLNGGHISRDDVFVPQVNG